MATLKRRLITLFLPRFGLGLTWTPELGVALGPPLSLASLALVKAVTCLGTFSVIFQKTRIPPCLAALGCAPVPPKPRDGPRPQPFRALSSQLLNRSGAPTTARPRSPRRPGRRP